ncbi:MAG: cytochrome c biogenesis protein CcsA [Firmicutes bacterium]|nr:cytochrome c biogenesis protein CcsA [Bacillota bacterium]
MRRRKQAIGLITLVVTVLAVYLVFMYAPVPSNVRDLPEVQKILYFHVSAAWIGFLAFFVVFVASILYLKSRDRKWDVLAASSAEIGVVFTTIVLLTGPIWGKAAWNAWWTWDPRLTTTLVLWFIYLAYIVIRNSAEEDEKRARLAAIFGIIGFVDVPIVFMAIRWWRTIHPVVFEAGQVGLTPKMLTTLFVSLIAFTFLYLYYLLLRLDIAKAKLELAGIKEKLRAKF